MQEDWSVLDRHLRDPHKRESHREQRRNFLYTVFAVLGMAAAISKNTLCPHHLSVRASLLLLPGLLSTT